MAIGFRMASLTLGADMRSACRAGFGALSDVPFHAHFGIGTVVFALTFALGLSPLGIRFASGGLGHGLALLPFGTWFITRGLSLAPGVLDCPVVRGLAKAGHLCDVKHGLFPDFAVPKFFVLDGGGEHCGPELRRNEAVESGSSCSIWSLRLMRSNCSLLIRTSAW